MRLWEFRIVEGRVDQDGPDAEFHVEVEEGFRPLAVRGGDEARNALAGHATYEVVFVREQSPIG